MGNLLSIVVHAANIHDTKSGILCTKQELCRDVDISEKIKPHQWEKLPWRWVVERTFGWLNHSRRLSKDYEISTSSEVAMVTISHIHTLLKRL